MESFNRSFRRSSSVGHLASRPGRVGSPGGTPRPQRVVAAEAGEETQQQQPPTARDGAEGPPAINPHRLSTSTLQPQLPPGQRPQDGPSPTTQDNEQGDHHGEGGQGALDHSSHRRRRRARRRSTRKRSLLFLVTDLFRRSDSPVAVRRPATFSVALHAS